MLLHTFYCVPFHVYYQFNQFLYYPSFYDLFVGPFMIPCVITNKDGSTVGNYPVLGKFIIDYPKPSNPSRLEGSVRETMDADGFTFVTQDITWDLRANF